MGAQAGPAHQIVNSEYNDPLLIGLLTSGQNGQTALQTSNRIANQAHRVATDTTVNGHDESLRFFIIGCRLDSMMIRMILEDDCRCCFYVRQQQQVVVGSRFGLEQDLVCLALCSAHPPSASCTSGPSLVDLFVSTLIRQRPGQWLLERRDTRKKVRQLNSRQWRCNQTTTIR